MSHTCPTVQGVPVEVFLNHIVIADSIAYQRNATRGAGADGRQSFRR